MFFFFPRDLRIVLDGNFARMVIPCEQQPISKEVVEIFCHGKHWLSKTTKDGNGERMSFFHGNKCPHVHPFKT